MSVATEITRLQNAKTSLKNSINAKNDNAHQITNELISAYSTFVDAIQQGGSSDHGGVSDVNFYDYDGKVLYAYNKEEFAELEAMPELPQREGLTGGGWTYTLADAKSYVAETGMLDIGATYVTTNNATRLYIELNEETLTPTISFAINGTATINWGDNSTADTVTGTSTSTLISTTHTYSQSGKYIVTITNTDKLYVWGANNTGSKFFWKNYTAVQDYMAINRKYQCCVYKLELGANVVLCDYGLSHMWSLKNIMISNGVTPNSTTTQRMCNETFSLVHITIPNGFVCNMSYMLNNNYSLQSICFGSNSVTLIGILTNCYALQSITTPPSATGLASTTIFNSIYALERIAIHSNLTASSPSLLKTVLKRVYFGKKVSSINAINSATSLREFKLHPETPITTFASQMFSDCTTLQEFTVPANVTTLGNYNFRNCRSITKITINSNVTSIPTYFCSSCYALKEINFPDTITSIGTYAFQDCCIVSKYIMPRDLTSIGTNAFAYNYGVEYYDFSKCISIPTLPDSQVFYRMPDFTRIVVPDDLYDTWIEASGWSYWASHIVKASQFNN